MPDTTQTATDQASPSPAVVPQHSLLGGAENMKLLFDTTMETLSLGTRIAQNHADELHTFRMTQMHNREAFYHAVNMGSLLSAQAGVTEAQQTVSPIRTGAADTQTQQPAGAVYPPIRNVDQSGSTALAGVQAAQEQIAANIAALGDVVTKLSDALTAALTTAAGTAAKNAQPAGGATS